MDRLCGRKNVTDEEIYQWLKGEVKLYSQYLEGECYGYIEEKYKWESGKRLTAVGGITLSQLISFRKSLMRYSERKDGRMMSLCFLSQWKIIGDRIRSISNDELQGLMDMVAKKTLEQIKKQLTGDELLKLLLSECSI